MKRSLIIFLLACLTGVIICGIIFYWQSGTTAIYGSVTPDEHVGISVAETMFGLSDAQLNQELNDMNSLGVGWIRFDIEWSDVQPRDSSTYDWTAIDRLVAAADAHHVKLLAILDYTPRWADSPTCFTGAIQCAPANPTLFSNFAKAAVARYASQGISMWEIWNEPNIQGSWQPQADPAAYTALLKSSYTAIKSIDPSATIITGGLGPTQTQDGSISPIDFLSQVYADGGKDYFDAVGDHPYSFPATPSTFMTWNAWSQIASTTPSLRSVMIANGDMDKKIWLTEFGAPTDGPGDLESSATDTTFAGNFDHVTEDLQAQIIGEGITLAQSYPWAGPLFIYSYKDLGTSTTTNENFFGILRYDGSTKPAYDTLKTLLTQK